jgi:hypothetical protein
MRTIRNVQVRAVDRMRSFNMLNQVVRSVTKIKLG